MIGICRIIVIFCMLSLTAAAFAAEQDKALRAGMIGLDTSHVPAFAKLFNAPSAKGDLAAIRIVAGFPGGSPDLPSSRDRVAGYTDQLKKMGIEIVDSIPALLDKVDVVLIMSVDGRPHLQQAIPVFRAKKMLYIDKPLAGTLTDAIVIAQLGEKYQVPWFSASSLRFSAGIIGMRANEKVGKVLGCDAWSPCSLEEHHPDLFWYGVHGVETLFTIMGPGIQSVTRVRSDGTELAVGLWDGGRIGTFRGIRQGKQEYGAMVFGQKAIAPAGSYGGYEPLCAEIGRFFKTGKPPVANEETLEIFAFMEAADESKRQNGAPVKIADIMAKAKQEAARKIEEIK